MSTPRRGPDAAYSKLEERIMGRDQAGASEAYYDIVRAGRPLAEIISEAVRIHAPYTHVPYHERIDDGYPNFVNNDHCLLSARATLDLAKMPGMPHVVIPTGAAFFRRVVEGSTRSDWPGMSEQNA